MKLMLKPPGTKRLKLICDVPLSTSAFKFNLRHYITAVCQMFVPFFAGRLTDSITVVGDNTHPRFSLTRPVLATDRRSDADQHIPRKVLTLS
jgi:hypothetical protein